MELNQELSTGIQLIKEVNSFFLFFNFFIFFLDNLTDEQIENNAKYAISISRKLGATVFLVWEDIRDMKIKMLTTFLAAIMDVYNLEFALKKEKNQIQQSEENAENQAQTFIS